MSSSLATTTPNHSSLATVATQARAYVADTVDIR